MFTKLLLAFDGSESARGAMARAAELAAALKAEIEVVTVGEDPGYTAALVGTDERRRQAMRFYGGVAEQAASMLRAAGLPAHPHVLLGDPGEVIVECARETGADLVVVGARRRSGVRRWAPGGTVARVVDEAPCSVLVVRVAAEEEP